MIDFDKLAEKGHNRTKFPQHKDVAFNMGYDAFVQKQNHLGLDQGPVNMGQVVHVYNFEDLRDRNEVPFLMEAVKNGAKKAGYTEGIIFINHE
jgi:hypothetical protein